MPSLSASIFGFATGIAIADKIDVVTSTHAAILMKSRRRIGRPSFWLSAVCGTRRMLCEPDCSQECYCRLDRRGSASAFRQSGSQKGAASRSRRYSGGRGLRLRRSSRTATCVLAVEGDAGPSGSGPVRTLRPSHLNGRNPYSRHKRSVAATTSERSRTSKS